MKYFAKCVGSKTKVYTAKADISRGYSAPSLRTQNAAIELVNFCSDDYPWLRSKDGFICKNYSKVFSGGVGIYNEKLYYVSAGYFYYDDKKYFAVGTGKKKFSHYNGKILIFPNMLYFDPETKKHGSFGVSTGEIRYRITNRTVGTVSWGLSCIVSDDVMLTSLFKTGDGIKIADERGLGISGLHTVIGTDEGLGALFFNKNEFGSGDTINLKGILSHGAPESCDVACVSGGRIWVSGNNKIQASTINDESNWAIGGENEKTSFTCDVLGGDKITACIDFEGNPVFFSEHKIYKMYGDRATNFYLRGCSDWGGVPSGMSDTVAVVRDKIFYVSTSGVMCFDGVSPSVIQNTPFDCQNVKMIGASDGDKYYLCVGEGDASKLYAYDVARGQWYDLGNYAFTYFFTYNNALCAYDGTKITVLRGHFDMMDEHEYTRELRKEARASFEIDTAGAKPLKICVECDTGVGANYNLYVRKKGLHINMQGDEILIGNVLPNFSGKTEFTLVPSKCDSIVVSVRGTGEILIKDISVELAT